MLSNFKNNFLQFFLTWRFIIKKITKKTVRNTTIKNTLTINNRKGSISSFKNLNILKLMVNYKKQQAFTLIEVLIALLIIAIGLPALIYSIGTQINQLSYLEEKLFSQWVASNEITKLQIANRQLDRLPTGKASGTEFMAGRKWQWSTESKEFTSLQWRGIYIVETKVFLDNPEAAEEPEALVTDYGYVFNSNASIPNLANLAGNATNSDLNSINSGASGSGTVSGNGGGVGNAN